MIARSLQLFCSVTGAVLVLVLGAWAGGAFAPALAAGGRPSRAADALSYAAKAADGQIEVGDALEVSGQPLRLSVFYTSDPPPEVAAFYAQAFQARHLIPIASAEDRVAHVSAFDPDDGLQRFINVVAQPNGQTLVVVGVTNPRKQPRFLDGAASASFPVPAQSRAFLGYSSQDASARAETAQFVSAQTTGELAAFYRTELAVKGWAERRGDSTEGILLFEKGAETLSVALQALDEQKGAAVFVNRLHETAK